MVMNESDYPAQFRSSDSAAKWSQRLHMFEVRTHLMLLGIAGVIGCWNPSYEPWGRTVSIAIAAIMFVALVLGLLLRLGGIDDAWFATRAIAENTKSATWRYMMSPLPQAKADQEQQDAQFLKELRDIRGSLPALEGLLARHHSDGPEITPKIREVRAMQVQDRLAFFCKHRLEDQLRWYRDKAKYNADKEHCFFLLIIAADVLAVAFATIKAIVDTQFNPAGAAVALAACFLAWSQTKRFSDLANSYGVATRDLNILESRANHVRTNEQLIEFANDVDSTISREHRLWVERSKYTG